ncbi:glycerol-3-phosphate dehydrogenase subunit GlpB [Vibrio sp. SS-MA-C1-2]|uniref:glycerol-3-phosphate dehydrogenase subunit GlpB n=1 Tax=Vibrio sp. SS-MA-C1-2 TaxID=2908646 RepID=UPI001F2B4CC5|nr:glycerol-3-phosphate dehydrogenase subunit GlpB [Vibrio sp. SS-MA-C1-2]UJF17261.1 glycerol-3-phosphate dehydrogenase subunit GlpB [Vibrio sp. SS-MA-C1-2]
MIFDTIIIGGGMAGYVAGLRCLEKGQKVAMISNGQSALHFSSGSIDLLSRTPDGRAIKNPFNVFDRFVEEFPNHPYQKIGKANVQDSLQWFRTELTNAGIPFTASQNGDNHLRLTSLGSFKSTWLSQPYVHRFPLDLNTHNIKRIVLVDIEGFRDFQSTMMADTLQTNPAFNGVNISKAQIRLQALTKTKRNPCELRSIDIARILSDNDEFESLAKQLSQQASHSDLVVIPAITGDGDGITLLNRLKERTDLRFHEVPTMPPSLLGIRLEQKMKHLFIKNGGSLMHGDQVLSADFNLQSEDLIIQHIYTRNFKKMPIKAKNFILATGSFFSKGLTSHYNKIKEPIFNLDLSAPVNRTDWYQDEFFTEGSHPFLTAGVTTNQLLQPSIDKKLVTNLYCTGAVLAGYNPVSEGCGSGVAISSAYLATELIEQNNLQALTTTEGQ